MFVYRASKVCFFFGFFSFFTLLITLLQIKFERPPLPVAMTPQHITTTTTTNSHFDTSKSPSKRGRQGQRGGGQRR